MCVVWLLSETESLSEPLLESESLVREVLFFSSSGGGRVMSRSRSTTVNDRLSC